MHYNYIKGKGLYKLMNKFIKIINNYTVIILVIAISSFTVLGIMQLDSKVDASLILKKVSSNPYLAADSFNEMMDKIHPVNDIENRTPEPEKEHTKKILEFLFVINTFLVSNNTTMMICLVMAFISLLLADKAAKKEIIRAGPLKPPEIVYYKNWILEFLTPVEKWMQNRAGEYDVNPAVKKLWGKTRILDLRSGIRVFFMAQ